MESFENPIQGQGKLILVECKTAISLSNLPGLDYALNPYFGCSHACTYCYAPFVLHQPTRDWGATVKVKVNIPKRVASELSKKRGTIGIGTVTDPYQSVEGSFSLTRSCLRELLKADWPISILTKSPLVTRDIDFISQFSSAEVGVTITTQRDDLAAQIEPGAPPPCQRFKAVKELVGAGIDTYVLIGPALPDITDADLNDFFAHIASTGVRRIMIDRLRVRSGMLAKIKTLPLMSDEKRWKDFDKKSRSDEYYCQFSRRVNQLCDRYTMKCLQAF